MKTDTKQNISSIRHFLKKRHWVSDVFAGMCLQAEGTRKNVQKYLSQKVVQDVHGSGGKVQMITRRHIYDLGGLGVLCALGIGKKLSLVLKYHLLCSQALGPGQNGD